MNETKRKIFTCDFKAKVALEAIRGLKTVNEIGQDFGVHPTQVTLWKKELTDQASKVFDIKRGTKPIDPSTNPDRLYSEIGRLKVGLDWLKKVRDQPLAGRKDWINVDDPLPLSRQCDLAGVTRPTVYPPPAAAPPDAEELVLLALIDEEYTRHPFYGSRKIRQYLKRLGYGINRKRVQRLMAKPGLAAMAPGPNTSRPPTHPQHKVYPYLLRGFVYLAAIIDWYSRKVLSWRVSNTMDSGFCVDCLKQALQTYGEPEIFNSDQGSQFTSDAFTGVLKEHNIAISMDGRGRALDNIFVERLWRSVKHEDVYLKGYSTLAELLVGLTVYFVFYNGEITHQSLGHNTPDEVYLTASGGGATIVDKYKDTEKTIQE